MGKDEFEVARIRVGVTRVDELNSILYPPNWKGAVGHQVDGHEGRRLHYWTNKDRSAVMEVTCLNRVVEAVRLKLGWWGPLASLSEVPAQARSDISLECLGTGHSVHVGEERGRQRITDVYGPPTAESPDQVHYVWHFGKDPRELTFTLRANGAIEEIFLTRVPSECSQGMRPIGPAEPYKRQLLLPPALDETSREGHTEASQQRIQQVEAHLESRRRLASFNPPEVLHLWFYLGQLRRIGGDPKACQELQALWDHLQVSDYFHQPDIQAMVRPLALELELVGVTQYAEEIRRSYS